MNENTSELDKPKPELVEMVSYAVFNKVGNYDRGGLCPKNMVQAQADPEKGETVREEKYEFKRSALRPSYRMERRKRYPSINDQLGAICDLAKTIRDGSEIELPDSVLDWIEQVDAVKSAYPKEEDY